MLEGEAVLWRPNHQKPVLASQHGQVKGIVLRCLAAYAQGAVAVEGEAVLWHPTANRPPWGSDSGLGDGPDAAGADSDGADSGDWYDDELDTSARAAVMRPSPAAATSSGVTPEGKPGASGAGERGRQTGNAAAGSGGSGGSTGEEGAGERGGSGEGGAEAAKQGPASAAETADARRVPHDWLVTIDADGCATAEPGPGSGGRADGAGGAGSAHSAQARSEPEDQAPQSGGALRGGFLPDMDPGASGDSAGSHSCCGGGSSSGAGGRSPGSRPADHQESEVAGGHVAGEPKELHPEVAAQLDAALAQIGAAREALGEGPLLGGVSASGIQSGAPLSVYSSVIHAPPPKAVQCCYRRAPRRAFVGRPQHQLACTHHLDVMLE